MFGGPWDSTLNMVGVPSLKLGVPSFYISFEFLEGSTSFHEQVVVVVVNSPLAVLSRK